ncbi:MAG: hypothetical protein C5B48_11210, partial [Candidatus Rokuibacteriota bacterium]
RRAVFIATPDDVATEPGARVEAATRLASFAAMLLEKAQPDLVAVTGGETAISLLRALGTDTIELKGAPGSGLALGDIAMHGSSVLPLLTKAGGFGGADLFVTLLGGS